MLQRSYLTGTAAALAYDAGLPNTAERRETVPTPPTRDARATGRRRLTSLAPIALGLSLVGASLALGRPAATPVLGALMPVGGGLAALGALALLWRATRRAPLDASAVHPGSAVEPLPGAAARRPGVDAASIDATSAGATSTPAPSADKSEADRSSAGKAASDDSPIRGTSSDESSTDATATATATATGEPSSDAPVPARLHAWSAEVFGLIEWRQFESLVEALFRQAGFEIRAQQHDAHGGSDLWLYSPADPGAPVSVVRCRGALDRRVGVGRLRELRGVMAARNVDRGQFVCASRFTPEAHAFALENGIHLIDGDRLLGLIARRTPAQRRALLDLAFAGEWWRPTCPTCGDKMAERTAGTRGRPFWGCVRFPRCRVTLPMR